MHESCDVVLLPATNETRRERGKRRIVKLAVFDMDSTLIDQEVIDELARFVGKYDDVANITASAMRGEIDFAESLKRRVALLKGVPSEVWEKMKPRLSFAEGARELCRALATLGVIMAVLSGGFTPMAEYVKSELGLHVAHANFVSAVKRSSSPNWLTITARDCACKCRLPLQSPYRFPPSGQANCNGNEKA